MKKIISFISLALLLPSLCFCLLTNNSVGEFRTTATNTNLNGGFFDATISGAGTDYSLQDAAQISLTDITCVQNSVTINSESGLFTAAMVGNGMQFTNAGSHTAGFYILTEFISTKSVKLNTTPYTGAGTSSGGTAKLGGALYLPTDTLLEYFVSGNVAYIKAGTYSITGLINIAANGTNIKPISLIGYNTTRGDNPTGSSRPVFSTGGNRFAFGQNWRISNISFTGSDSFGTLYTGNAGTTFYNCRFENTANNSSASAINPNTGHLVNFEAMAQYGAAVTQADPAILMNGYIHDSLIGINGAANNSFQATNIVIDTCGTGIVGNATARSRSLLSNSVIYGCTTGINLNSNPNLSVINTIISGNTVGVTNNVVSTGVNFYNNLWYNTTNTQNITLNSTNITGQDPLMADPANGDFSLTAGSPAYNAGLGISNTGVTGTYYQNIGVDQEQAATGTGAKSWAY